MFDSFLAKLSTLEGPMPKQKEQASQWLYYKSCQVSKQPGLKQTDMIWYDMIIWVWHMRNQKINVVPIKSSIYPGFPIVTRTFDYRMVLMFHSMAPLFLILGSSSQSWRRSNHRFCLSAASHVGPMCFTVHAAEVPISESVLRPEELQARYVR
jgi:hypothetical protein